MKTLIPAPPSLPAGLQGASLGKNGATLIWNLNAGGGIVYELERKAEGGEYTKIADIASGEATFTDTDLAAGTKYTYRIRAKGVGGYSSYSDEISITTAQIKLPADIDMAIRLNEGDYLGINMTTWNVTPLAL